MDDGPPSPVVSGVSPNEGPPGTKLTIRGENLGESLKDIVDITIGGQSCKESLEYVNSKKLFCLTPNFEGPTRILVTTLSGGVGSCTVSYYGHARPATPKLDPMEESSVWQEEDMDLLVSYSAQPPSPVYSHRKKDPMGAPSSMSAGGKKKLSHENLGAMFPHGSGDLLAENFNPAWFLLERYRFSTFEELRDGRNRLKREVRKSENAPVKFMQDNLDAFLLCYQTLSDVNELLIRNESESQGGSLTDRAEELLKESARSGESLFSDVLRCKVRADQTRSALTVLQRYKFLFNLPHTIEKNISNGEYEIVANDYDKAKTLFANTKVSVFKRVLAEVEKQLAKFRDDLRKKLLKLPSSLEEQKKLIKYLLELDCEGDPAWDCLSNMHQWMLRLLYNTKEEFQGTPAGKLPSGDEYTDGGRGGGGEQEVRGKEHSRTVSDVSFISTGSGSQGTTTPAFRSHAKTGEWHYVGSRGDAGPPNRILFVEEITGLMAESLPEFWKLGQAYISGSLFQGMQMVAERQRQQQENCDKNKDKFENKMLMEVVEVFTDMVNCSLFPEAYEQLTKVRRNKLGEWAVFEDGLAETSGAWLPQIVREIRVCVGSLQKLPLPDKAVDMTRTLAVNVRTLCVDTLFHRAARDIEVLHEREDWQVHAEESGAITSLPILFENLVVEVLLSLKEVVIETHHGETAESADPLMNCSVEHLHALMEHFIGCLEYLAFQQDDETEDTTSIHSREKSVDDVPGDTHTLTPDEQLLVLLSNLHYTGDQVIPRLFDCFVSHGYPSCPQVSDVVREMLMELDQRLFRSYIDHKSEAVVDSIEQGMRTGMFDWEQCAQEPATVRTYIQDIILSLVTVHCEVYTVSPSLVGRVLHQLVLLIAQEILRVFQALENINHNGALHAFVEITALEETLSVYTDEETHQHFQSCRELLGGLNADSEAKMREIVSAFKKRTSLMTTCFRHEQQTELQS
jgi:exocyst complex component 2